MGCFAHLRRKLVEVMDVAPHTPKKSHLDTAMTYAINNEKYLSGLTIKKYCNDNHICISSFYKQKALILDEENIFCFQTASMEPKQVERRTA